MAVIIALALQFFQIALIVAIAPFVLGITRKVRARLLCRRGRRCCRSITICGN